MLEFFFFLILTAVLFSFQPFTTSVFVPSEIRVPLLLMFTSISVLFSIKKKKVFYFFLVGSVVFSFLVYIWLKNSPDSLSDIIYVIVLIFFTYCLYHFLKRAPNLFWLLVMFWLLLLLVVSFFSILSFISFNFHLLPFKKTTIGAYNYYYHPLLGYVHLKEFKTSSLGRACYFMLEPSYLAFFLTTNFFFINSFPINPGLKIAVKFIVFLGALCTVSTASWVVFGLIFGISIAYQVIRRLSQNELVTKVMIYSFIILFVVVIVYTPTDKLISIFGTSSYTDRQNRAGESLLILAGSDMKHLLFGNSPAYLEKAFQRGESDQFFKLLVEEGIIITILVIAFVIYCIKYNFKYMMAILLFLNSAVVLWTPLFCINIVLCRLLTEPVNQVKNLTDENDF